MGAVEGGGRAIDTKINPVYFPVSAGKYFLIQQWDEGVMAEFCRGRVSQLSWACLTVNWGLGVWWGWGKEWLNGHYSPTVKCPDLWGAWQAKRDGAAGWAPLAKPFLRQDKSNADEQLFFLWRSAEDFDLRLKGITLWSHWNATWTYSTLPWENPVSLWNQQMLF